MPVTGFPSCPAARRFTLVPSRGFFIPTQTFTAYHTSPTLPHTHLEEVLVHARHRLAVLSHSRTLHPCTVQRVLHSRVRLTKTELLYGVCEVQCGIAEGGDVVDVHVALLVGAAWRKVEVARNLVNLCLGRVGGGQDGQGGKKARSEG